MQLLSRYKLILVGVVLGGIAGYAYYFFIGCSSGQCAITSSPLNSTAYGMIMGGLSLDLFNKKGKPAGDEKEAENKSEEK